MKIRCGFVTNSSSSSFILAMKNDIEKEVLLNIIESHKDGLNRILEYYKCFDLPIEIFEKIEKGEKEKATELIALELVNQILSENHKMKLDNWNVIGGYCSNESDNLLEYFLYTLGDINEEDFKFKETF